MLHPDMESVRSPSGRGIESAEVQVISNVGVLNASHDSLYAHPHRDVDGRGDSRWLLKHAAHPHDANLSSAGRRTQGVSAEADSVCRQQAYQAAEKAKQDNVNKEVAFTAIGTIAGAVIGNQITTPGHGGRGPGGPGGGPGGPGRGHGGHDLAGAGALTGAATGAAMSQGTLQDTQQTYDINYNNCIESHRGGRY